MEDTKNRKSQPNATDPNKGPIIELTPAREVQGEIRGKIIDLVHERHDPEPADSDVAPDSAPPADPGEPAYPVRATPEAQMDDGVNTLDTPVNNVDGTTVDGRRPVETGSEIAQHSVQTDEAGAASPLSKVEPVERSSFDEPDPLDDFASQLELDLDIPDPHEPISRPRPDEEAEEIELSLDPHIAPSDTHAQAFATENGSSPDDLDDLLPPDDLIDSIDPIDDREATWSASADPDRVDPALLLEDEDDAILELTDIVDPEAPGVAEGDPRAVSSGQDEEPVIELTQILDLAQMDDLAEAEEDAILELTDIVEPADADAHVAIPDDDVLALIPDDDDAVLELTDTVDPQPEVADSLSVPADCDPIDDDLVELTEIVALAEEDGDPRSTVPNEPSDVAATDIEPAPVESAGPDVTMTEGDPSVTTPAQSDAADPPPVPDLIEAQTDTVIRLDSVLKAHKQRIAEQVTRQIDEELTTGEDEDEGRTDLELDNADRWPAKSTELTEKALQKALEEVIRTQYARRIEEMIAVTVERVVTREMESIRNSLMGDDETDA